MVREGTDVSIITYGAVVHRAEVAAAELARNGISAEILDLRSLSPYDWEAIAATVRKTNRVLVAYEDTRSWGYGAEIAARIADELFDELDCSGPPRGRHRHFRAPINPGSKTQSCRKPRTSLAPSAT